MESITLHTRIITDKNFHDILFAIRSHKPIYVYNTNILLDNYTVQNLETFMTPSDTHAHHFPEFRVELVLYDVDNIMQNRNYFQNMQLNTNNKRLSVTVTLRPQDVDTIPFGGSQAGKLLYGKT